MTPDPNRSSRGDLASYAHLGSTAVVCVVLGLAAGFWLDRWLGTQPWLLLAGLGFGVAAAVVTFYRAIMELEHRNEQNGDA